MAIVNRPPGLNNLPYFFITYDRDSQFYTLLTPDEQSYDLGSHGEQTANALPYLTRALGGRAELAEEAMNCARSFCAAIVDPSEISVVLGTGGLTRAQIETKVHEHMFGPDLAILTQDDTDKQQGTFLEASNGQ